MAIVAQLKDKDLVAAGSATMLLREAATQVGLDQWNQTLKAVKPALDSWEPFGRGQRDHETFTSPWMVLERQMSLDKNTTFSFDWFVSHDPVHAEYKKLFDEMLDKWYFDELYKVCQKWTVALDGDATVPLLFLCHVVHKQRDTSSEDFVPVRDALVAFVVHHYVHLPVPNNPHSIDILRALAVGVDDPFVSVASLWSLHAGMNFSKSGTRRGRYLSGFYDDATNALKQVVDLNPEFVNALITKLRRY
jgi:hypothetical protein